MSLHRTLGGDCSKKVYENNGLHELTSLVRSVERRILDVGCGTGGNARRLVGPGRELHGITLSRIEARMASPYFKRISIVDIETNNLRYPRGYFDAIIFSHVLEHTVDPWKVLRRLGRYLRKGGRCYIALPNIAYYKNRLSILCGGFSYCEYGIMDRTHLRFFTFATAVDLVQSTGYRLIISKAAGSFPIWPVRSLFGTDTWIDRIAVKVLPNLFGNHLIIVAERPRRD